MIRALNAFTAELDDANTAVEEILQQLHLPQRQLAHTVGIMTCHYDFVDAGIAQAVCDALPFDVVGSTITGQSINGSQGVFSLSLLVMTSDDVRFETAVSAPLTARLEASIEEAYAQAAQRLEGQPGMVLAFAPLLLQYAGDQYVEILDRLSGGVPAFGTLSMDDTTDYTHCYTIFNGRCERDTLALVLLQGDIRPRFFVATVSGSNALTQPARITASEGNLLKTVNDVLFIDFLQSLGLAHEGEIDAGLTCIVCLLDLGDGSPPMGRVLINVNGEGHGVCGGYMPEGARMYLSVLTKEDVVDTTHGLVSNALGDAGGDLLLAFSCHTRNVALGDEVYAEFDAVRALVGEKLPYLMSTSGGELCPYITDDQRTVNRFHNNSVILCVL